MVRCRVTLPAGLAAGQPVDHLEGHFGLARAKQLEFAPQYSDLFGERGHVLRPLRSGHLDVGGNLLQGAERQEPQVPLSPDQFLPCLLRRSEGIFRLRQPN